MKKLFDIILSFIIVATFIFPFYSFSQITLTSQDLLNLIGSKQTVLFDQRLSIPVDVGSAGPNQIWDFRSMTMEDTIVTIFEFLSPMETSSYKTYPEANLVQKITSPTEPGSEFFNFYKVSNSEFISLGDSIKFVSPFDTAFVSFQEDTLAPLPIAFNNTWLSTEVDTTGIFPFTANISIDTTMNSIDAWGTVRLPVGDFDCMRLRQDIKVINYTIVNGTIFSTTIDSYIQYDWIAKGIFHVASAQSQNGNTDPNFTNAQGFSWLDASSTGIDDVRAESPVSDFALGQNYPNPFNPETTINYDLSAAGKVTLKIYDITGRQISVLESAQKSAGNYSVRWDGSDYSGNQVASGVYFYRLEATSLDGKISSLTRKMTLIR